MFKEETIALRKLNQNSTTYGEVVGLEILNFQLNFPF
jgi:hypothetical protein